MEIKKLYHYTKLSKAIEKILPQGKLLINTLTNLNDPREKDFAVNYKMNGVLIDDDEIKLSKLDPYLNEKIKVLCFSVDKKYENKIIKGYHLMSMWAHYGDNHRGVCIEIDKEKFYQENEEIIKSKFFKKVEYNIKSKFEKPLIDTDRIKENGFEKEISDLVEKNSDYLFFEKYIDWEWESEFRLMYKGKNEEEFCFIKNSLSAIYLGNDCNENYIPSIRVFTDKTIKKIKLINNKIEEFDR